MTDSLWKAFGASAIVLGLFAVNPAFANMNDWDTNTDQRLDQTEFSTGFKQRGLYDKWDADNNDVLTNEEFTAGIGDRTDKFNERFGANAFETWNTDGADGLTENEFYEGVYGAYDADDDTYVNPAEYEAFEDDAGEGGFWDI